MEHPYVLAVASLSAASLKALECNLQQEEAVRGWCLAEAEPGKGGGKTIYP